MTLEEAKALAGPGNVNAMMALAYYYSKNESEDDIETAFHYPCKS